MARGKFAKKNFDKVLKCLDYLPLLLKLLTMSNSKTE
jgi:hypothetical protein